MKNLFGSVFDAEDSTRFVFRETLKKAPEKEKVDVSPELKELKQELESGVEEKEIKIIEVIESDVENYWKKTFRIEKFIEGEESDKVYGMKGIDLSRFIGKLFINSKKEIEQGTDYDKLEKKPMLLTEINAGTLSLELEGEAGSIEIIKGSPAFSRSKKEFKYKIRLKGAETPVVLSDITINLVPTKYKLSNGTTIQAEPFAVIITTKQKKTKIPEALKKSMAEPLFGREIKLSVRPSSGEKVSFNFIPVPASISKSGPPMKYLSYALNYLLSETPAMKSIEKGEIKKIKVFAGGRIIDFEKPPSEIKLRSASLIAGKKITKETAKETAWGGFLFYTVELRTAYLYDQEEIREKALEVEKAMQGKEEGEGEKGGEEGREVEELIQQEVLTDQEIIGLIKTVLVGGKKLSGDDNERIKEIGRKLIIATDKILDDAKGYWEEKLEITLD